MQQNAVKTVIHIEERTCDDAAAKQSSGGLFFLQDSIDLFLGNYAVDEADWTTPLRDPKDWKFLTVRRAQEARLTTFSFSDVFNVMPLFFLLVAHHHGCCLFHVYNLPSNGR